MGGNDDDDEDEEKKTVAYQNHFVFSLSLSMCMKGGCVFRVWFLEGLRLGLSDVLVVRRETRRRKRICGFNYKKTLV